MRCLITGTRYGRADVWHWMVRFVRRYGVPELFVLGDNWGLARWYTWADGRREYVRFIGVDALAQTLCRMRGWPYRVLPADWTRLGKRAGFLRNADMVAACGPGDFALAFPSGVQRSGGTWHCAGLANDAGLKVFVVPHVRVLRPVSHAA